MAMYLCKTLTHASLPEIGKQLWRQAPLDRDSFDQEDRGLRKTDGDFNSLINNFLGVFQMRLAPVSGLFPQVRYTVCVTVQGCGGRKTHASKSAHGSARFIHRNIHSLTY